MTPNVLRGVSALCLLCVLPKLGATVLTITQAASFQVSNANSGQNLVGYSAVWSYTPFNPSLGVLESVTFTAVATATVSAGNVNWYDFSPGPPPTPTPPRMFIPYTALHVNVTPNLMPIPTLNASDYSYGAPVLVEVGGVFSHTAIHTITVSETTTDLGLLARYSDPALSKALLIAQGEGYGRFGGMSIDGTIQTLLIYNYRVPENGATITLFALALGVIASVRNLRRKRL
jgi:hypothetical protein